MTTNTPNPEAVRQLVVAYHQWADYTMKRVNFPADVADAELIENARDRVLWANILEHAQQTTGVEMVPHLPARLAAIEKLIADLD